MEIASHTESVIQSDRRGIARFFVVLVVFFIFALPSARAEGGEAASSDASAKVSADSSQASENVVESSEGRGALYYIGWPFNHIIQPILNGVIFPVSAPLHYAFDNGIVEKSVNMITFGERKNVMIYPTMNLKPGSRTLLGLTYRHRSLVFSKDYSVLQGEHYANGDWYVSWRYSKQQLFGLPMFGAFRYKQYWNRDDVFILPGTKEEFVQPDSSIHLDFRLGAPVTPSRKINAEFQTTVRWIKSSPPDIEDDSLLVNDIYPIADRGLYQDVFQVPLTLSIVYDDLDHSFAPSRGSRISMSGQYVFVGDYGGIDFSELKDDRYHKHGSIEDGGKEHDYIRSELMFQHYFYLGKTENFILSATEARKARKFYTDFSWDEALRVWHPSHLRETLLERRVLAFQYRFLNMWEMEKGGAPHNAFYTMNARLPLRGFADTWAASHIMSFSAEYRWPVDRFIDGVIFDEYALHTEDVQDWSLDRFYNSWGIGVRVRMPDMYLFRFQVGFHGLQGVNLVLTIAPEFQ